MKEVYLNHADGRKERKLSGLKVNNPARAFRFFVSEIRNLLGVSQKDLLAFSQNATTSLIHSVSKPLRNGEYRVFLSSHEIHWYKTLFSKGAMPMDEVTFPGYAKLHPVRFLKRKVHTFDPHKLAKNPQKVLGKEPAIVIISHVSRLTGEVLLTPSLFRKIKKLNQKNLVVADGSQAIGAMKVKAGALADIYVGVTSKFIQAEPHIGFCWIVPHIVRDFRLKAWSISPNEFRREIYSALRSLRKLRRKRSVKGLRIQFKKELRENGISILQVPRQVDHFLLVPSKRPREAVQRLKEGGIIVSSNTGWGVAEPETPGLRISISPQLKRWEIGRAVRALAEIKKDGLL